MIFLSLLLYFFYFSNLVDLFFHIWFLINKYILLFHAIFPRECWAFIMHRHMTSRDQGTFLRKIDDPGNEVDVLMHTYVKIIVLGAST